MENDMHSKILNNAKFSIIRKFKDTPSIVKCNYTCLNNKCNFDECLYKILTNNILEETKSADYCAQVVQDIAKNQYDWKTHSVEYYNIQKGGVDLVELRRTDVEYRTPYAFTGIIEYYKVKKFYMEPYDQ